jgi:hypothetical protein
LYNRQYIDKRKNVKIKVSRKAIECIQHLLLCCKNISTTSLCLWTRARWRGVCCDTGGNSPSNVICCVTERDGFNVWELHTLM